MTDYEVEDLPIDDALAHLDGAVMPERVLQEILKGGFAAVKLDQTLIKEMFYKLPAAALKDLVEYFAKNTITVRQGLPVGETPKYPVIAITNAADNEDTGNDMMGDFMGSSLDVAKLENVTILGHALRSEYQVFCLAGKDSNAALYLYYVAKAILAINAGALDSHGLHNVIYNGRDITLRDDLFPELTFARVLSITCGNYFAIRSTERVAKSLQVNVFTEEPFSDTKELLEEDT